MCSPPVILLKKLPPVGMIKPMSAQGINHELVLSAKMALVKETGSLYVQVKRNGLEQRQSTSRCLTNVHYHCR